MNRKKYPTDIKDITINNLDEWWQAASDSEKNAVVIKKVLNWAECSSKFEPISNIEDA